MPVSRSNRCPRLEAKHAPWCEEGTGLWPRVCPLRAQGLGNWAAGASSRAAPLSLPTSPHLPQPSALCFTPTVQVTSLRSSEVRPGSWGRRQVQTSAVPGPGVVRGRTPRRSPGSQWPRRYGRRRLWACHPAKTPRGWQGGPEGAGQTSSHSPFFIPYLPNTTAVSQYLVRVVITPFQEDRSRGSPWQGLSSSCVTRPRPP